MQLQFPYYYRFKDKEEKDFSESDWVYEKFFAVNDALMHNDEQWLILEGVDTFGSIYLNNDLVGHTHNMFITYVSI